MRPIVDIDRDKTRKEQRNTGGVKFNSNYRVSRFILIFCDMYEQKSPIVLDFSLFGRLDEIRVFLVDNVSSTRLTSLLINFRSLLSSPS